MSEQFPFKIGEKIANEHWKPDEHVVIEWVRDSLVAGVSYPSGEAFVRDWAEVDRKAWRLWVEPLVRRQWIIETERRRAEVGARYCVWHAEDATTIGPILKGDLIDGAVRDVIVSVRPVDGFAGEDTK